MTFRFALLILTAAALAASDDNWNNLDRLSAGNRIRVVATDRKAFSGAYVSRSSDQIVVRVNGADVVMAREKVARITKSSGLRRTRNAVILGLAGAVVGGGAMRFGLGCAENINGCRNVALVAMIGGALGAGAGAALPATVTIYRVKKLP